MFALKMMELSVFQLSGVKNTSKELQKLSRSSDERRSLRRWEPLAYALGDIAQKWSVRLAYHSRTTPFLGVGFGVGMPEFVYILSIPIMLLG